jgi:hypothetical protein
MILLRILKKIFFWGYGRSTWQYDVLCALILAFIFLTPRDWFNNGELPSRAGHHTPVASTRLLINAEMLSAQPDKAEIERCARQLTNRPELKITGARPILNADGKATAYEVDIQ